MQQGDRALFGQSERPGCLLSASTMRPARSMGWLRPTRPARRRPVGRPLPDAHPRRESTRRARTAARSDGPPVGATDVGAVRGVGRDLCCGRLDGRRSQVDADLRHVGSAITGVSWPSRIWASSSAPVRRWCSMVSFAWEIASAHTVVAAGGGWRQVGGWGRGRQTRSASG